MKAPALLMVAVGGCQGGALLPRGITAEEHEKSFPITEGAPHALGTAAQDGRAISCDGCHAGTESFREALCFSCHQLDALPLALAHGAVAGFQTVDSSCLACHPSGLRGAQSGGATHSELWFPIDAEDVHGNAAYVARLVAGQDACSACHASVADRTIPLCKECHAADATPLASAHELVIRTFVNDSVKCKECHADIPISPVVRPVTQHDAIFPVVNHHAAKCTDCHQAYRAEPQPWAIDFTVGLCTRCHIAACTTQNQGACN